MAEFNYRPSMTLEQKRRMANIPQAFLDKLTPEQQAALVSPQRFLGDVRPIPQQMRQRVPSLTDRMRMGAVDAFGANTTNSRAFDSLVDLSPLAAVDMLSDAKMQYDRGDYLSSAGNTAMAVASVPFGGRAKAASEPINKGVQKVSENAQKAIDFFRKNDVTIKPEAFGRDKMSQLTRYGRTLDNPAVRRRDVMRLQNLQEATPAQFGIGGFKMGEIGTQGVVAPVEKLIVEPSELMGRAVVPFVGDTTDIREISQVAGIPVSRTVNPMGGPNFRDGWSSNLGAAQKVYNAAIDASRFDPNPLGIVTSMSPEGINFNKSVVDTMLQMTQQINIPRTVKKDFDRQLRNTTVNKNGKITKPFADFVGLDSPQLYDQLFGNNNFSGQSGDLRKAVVEQMASGKYRDQGFPVYSDVSSAIIRRELAAEPAGNAGYSIFEIDPVAGLTPELLHHTYDTRIPGKSSFGLRAPIPIQAAMPKTFEAMSGLTNKTGKPMTTREKVGRLGMKPTFEIVDQQSVDSMSEALEKSKPFTQAAPQSFRFPDEVGAFGRGRTTRSTSEQIPGAGIGHLEGVTTGSPALRSQFSNEVLATNSAQQDALYAAQGLPMEKSIFGRGLYQPEGLPIESNEMVIGQPILSDLSSARATEAARAYVDVQNAGAAHRILPKNQTKPSERVDLSIDIPNVTEEQLSQINSIADNNGYFPIDSGDQVVLKNYDDARISSMKTNPSYANTDRAKVEKEIRDIIPGVKLTRQKIDTDTSYVDFQEAFKKANEGQGLATTKLFAELEQKPKLRDAIEPVIQRKAQANLLRDAKYSAQYGFPVRPDIVNAQKILVAEGFSGLKKALKDGAVLPAIGAMILSPAFLDKGSDQ